MVFHYLSLFLLYINTKIGKNSCLMSKHGPTNRAPDNFLKQGVADASLEAKGVFLQNPEVLSLPSFHSRAFLEVANIV